MPLWVSLMTGPTDTAGAPGFPIQLFRLRAEPRSTSSDTDTDLFFRVIW